MRRVHSRAGECADAVALSRDPYRLHAAPDCELVTAATVLAKGLVSMIDGGGLRAQRASALDLLDNAGLAIGGELVDATKLSAGRWIKSAATAGVSQSRVPRERID
jgi:hypothetical protein